MDLNALAAELSRDSVNENGLRGVMALCGADLLGALMESEKGRAAAYGHCTKPECTNNVCPEFDCPAYRLEGAAFELADCIIRILGYCGKERIDIEWAIRTKLKHDKREKTR